MRGKILNLLRSAGEKFISGEEIANTLGVSRTAIWKHIKDLRNAGYDIESQSRNGYRIASVPDRLLADEIKNNLSANIVGTEIYSFDKVDSTNEKAKEMARKENIPDGTVLVAEEQTGGKGRLQRSFFSPPDKGIWFSVVLRPDFLPQEAPKCTLMAAVAVAAAMRESGVECGIKWPNDILDTGHDNRKLTGILTEMSAEIDRINYVVIGIGINVNISLEEFPEYLREKAGSMLIAKGEKTLRVPFLQNILRHLDRLYLTVKEKGFAPIMEEWRKYSITLGQEINVIGVTTNEVYSGKAIDIDNDGALMVQVGEEIRKVVAGDVSIRPKK